MAQSFLDSKGKSIAGLTFSSSDVSTLKFKEVLPKKAVGWYCIGHEGFYNTTAFATYYKPNAIKKFFMRTLLDFYWIKDENK